MKSANAVIMCVLLAVLPIGKLTAQPENQAPAPPEFTELKNGYEKARAKIEVDMQTKLMQLNGQYTGALNKLIVKLSQQGNLDGALVVRNEKEITRGRNNQKHVCALSQTVDEPLTINHFGTSIPVLAPKSRETQNAPVPNNRH